ncbi:MAG: type II toxin-antitoxin system RelB/DinJ family antitoxin [bacterium]
MKEATISARMNGEKKKKVEKIFAKLGLSHSSAINLFYSQIILKEGLPFEADLKTEKNKAVTASEAFESAPQYGFKKEIFENFEDFPKDLRFMLKKFGNSKKAKVAIVKLALEYFLDELEFAEESENRLNDEQDSIVSYEEFKKQFGL